MELTHPDTQQLPPPPPRAGLSRAWQPVGLAVALGAGCIYVALVNPNTSNAFPQCPFKAATGWDCPGCGATRAVYSLLHADLAGALSHNVLFILALPFILYAMVVWSVKRIWDTQLPMFKWHDWMTFAGAAMVLGFAVLRNLPQHSWLGATA